MHGQAGGSDRVGGAQRDKCRVSRAEYRAVQCNKPALKVSTPRHPTPHRAPLPAGLPAPLPSRSPSSLGACLATISANSLLAGDATSAHMGAGFATACSPGWGCVRLGGLRAVLAAAAAGDSSLAGEVPNAAACTARCALAATSGDGVASGSSRVLILGSVGIVRGACCACWACCCSSRCTGDSCLAGTGSACCAPGMKAPFCCGAGDSPRCCCCCRLPILRAAGEVTAALKKTDAWLARLLLSSDSLVAALFSGLRAWLSCLRLRCNTRRQGGGVPWPGSSCTRTLLPGEAFSERRGWKMQPGVSRSCCEKVRACCVGQTVRGRASHLRISASFDYGQLLAMPFFFVIVDDGWRCNGGGGRGDAFVFGGGGPTAVLKPKTKENGAPAASLHRTVGSGENLTSISSRCAAEIACAEKVCKQREGKGCYSSANCANCVGCFAICILASPRENTKKNWSCSWVCSQPYTLRYTGSRNDESHARSDASAAK